MGNYKIIIFIFGTKYSPIINLRKELDKYIKLNRISYLYFNRIDGLKGLSGICCSGSIKFKTLFETAKVLNVDVSNLLMFDNNTYIF